MRETESGICIRKVSIGKSCFVSIELKYECKVNIKCIIECNIKWNIECNNR